MTEPATPRRSRGRPPGPAVDRPARTEGLLDAAERSIRASGSHPSLVAIANEAGFSRSAVYAAFPDKDSLFRALSERHALRIANLIAAEVMVLPDPRDRLGAFVDGVARWAEADPEIYRVLGRAPDGIFSVLGGWLEALLTLTGADARRAAPWARAMVGATEGVVAWWMDDRTMDRTEMVDQVVSLYWDGASALPMGVLGLDISEG